MALKLWHCKGSRSIRPLWTLEEMGLDYELVVMEFPPRHMQEGYTDLNPIGTVPFFTDGQVKMTESAGISEYIAHRYGPTELAIQPHETSYGDYLNWIHRSDATCTFPQTIALPPTLFEPSRGPEGAVEAYIKWCLTRLKVVEQTLKDLELLCSDCCSFSYICVGMALCGVG